MRIGTPLLVCALALLFMSQSLMSATSDVTLVWTAPGDNGMVGRAVQYDLRYATFPITNANWSQATRVADLPAPKPAGSREVFKVTGLLPATTYYFSLKAADARPNWSLLSNVAYRTTCPDGCDGQNGNVNGSADGKVDLSDLAVLTSYVTGTGGVYTICLSMCNTDSSPDGVVDLSDLSTLLAFLLQGTQFLQCPQ